MLAIIGGSGFEDFAGIKTIAPLSQDTPYGQASSGIQRIEAFQNECIFVPRHGKDHELSPSEVNFRANFFALKQAGVNRILSFSSVGSLRKDIAPGDLVVPSQFIDRTKGTRQSTFCEQGLVAHVSLAQPIWVQAKDFLQSNAWLFSFKAHFDKTYICVEGPGFSTRAESLCYRQIGADIIGMTAFPEYALARELGISYLPCCFITDYDSWDPHSEHVTLPMILDILKQNNEKAYALIKSFLEHTLPADPSIEAGLAGCLLSKGSLGPRAQILMDLLNRERERL